MGEIVSGSLVQHCKRVKLLKGVTECIWDYAFATGLPVRVFLLLIMNLEP